MPLPIIADTFRVTVNTFASGSGTAANVIHVGSNTLTDAEVGEAMAVLVANGDSPWTNLMSVAATIDSIDVIALDGTSPTLNFPVTGGDGVISGEANVAAGALVSLRTSVRGPSGRGRIYIPYTGEAIVNGGFLTETGQTDAQTGMDAWVDELVAEDLVLGVASYVDSVFRPASTVLVERPLATQRRRQDRLRT